MLDFRENPDGDALTVSQLTRRIKNLVEGSFGTLTVAGEVTNFMRAASGHLYFSLKDAGAKVDVVMWRSAAVGLRCTPKNGDQVIIRGGLSVYEPRGNYQFIAASLRPAGAGGERAALEALMLRLRSEGLFAPEHKQYIPAFALTVGMVTSPTGAAVRDMIKVVRKRLPCAQLVLSPCQVQGAGAPADIVRALRRIDAYGKCDVIMLGRGGGSQEDLAAFNDESVVRAVYACTTPVISSVGHEIDTSLCDLAADKRAATPSEAAEIAVPEIAQLQQIIARFRERLDAGMKAAAADARAHIQNLQHTLALCHPLSLLRRQQQRCDEIGKALAAAGAGMIRVQRQRWEVLAARLEAISPIAVLRRGYSITRDEFGKVIRTAAAVHPGKRLRITFAEGEAEAAVIQAKV